MLLAMPIGSYAQQQNKVWRVGFLAVRARSTASKPEVEYDAFAQGMRELGYVEGKNLLLDWRSADQKYERFPDMASDLVRLKVDVIVTEGTPATQAAQRATRSIPIVAAVVADPVASGFAASLGRPGGNITGLSSISVDISAKQMELLKTMAPKLSRVAVVTNPDASHHPIILKNLQIAAKQIRVSVLPVNARSAADIDRAFAVAAREHAEAVIIASDAFFSGRMRQIAALALQRRLPSIYTLPGYVQAGGLMSYGQNLIEHFTHAATYVDKILKGAKPGDLPIEQPTKIHLAINRKAAKGLGITVPQELLLRADEVID
jgi:putative ABC transport system substrate-binding protein